MAEPLEPVAAKYAADWPAWGHRKIHCLMQADGHAVSASSVERAPRRRGLLQPIDYTGERRELAKARKAAFAEPPVRSNEVWQLDFSEYETTTGGIDDLPALAAEAEAYRQVFNHLRPHQTLGGRRPIEVYRDPALHPNIQIKIPEPSS